MRNTLLSTLAAVSLLAISGSALAQEGESAKPFRTVTVNPLALAFGSFSAEFEQATASRGMSFFVGPSYYSTSSSGLIDLSTTSYGLTGGVRFFLGGRAPEGFYLSPGVSLGYGIAEGGGEEATSATWSLDGQAGYTWLFNDVFDLSLGLGLSYMSYELNLPGTLGSIGYQGIAPNARLAVGAAF